MSRWRGLALIADGLHAARGTRGLTVAAALLLLAAAVEPALPDAFPNIVYTLPLLVLLAAGLLTLPREAIAVQGRARSLLDNPGAPKRMMKRAAWGVVVVFVLSPNIFLAVQGAPHLSPLAGLALPEMIRWVSLLGLALTLLLVVLYLRSSRSYAPSIATRRPREFDDKEHDRWEVLVVLLFVIVVAWGWMLQGFWRPFSLFQWHGVEFGGYFASLTLGARGIAGLAFAVLPPALLFIVLSAHAEILWEIGRRRSWRDEVKVAALAGLHGAFCLLGIILHTYNLLWIVRFRSMGFL